MTYNDDFLTPFTSNEDDGIAEEIEEEEGLETDKSETKEKEEDGDDDLLGGEI